MDKLYIDDSISPVAGKPSTNYRLPHSGSSLITATQSSQSRAQGRGLPPSGQMNFQPTLPQNQVNRGSPSTQRNTAQRSPVQSRVQPSLQASVQQLGQRPGSGSQASSPPDAALSIHSFETGELESPPESSKSKTALVGKGKGGVQVVMVIKIFLQLQLFCQLCHLEASILVVVGVPAVGMAFPGYVAQPQLGLGNSEMTWLPVLTSAAGALGATYCSPYIAVDGAYHARPSGQTSSSGASSKENNTNKPSNEWKPSQRPERASDEFGQRQNNPRRYSKMNFGHTLGCDIFDVILGIYDKRLLMLRSFKEHCTA
ncbi:hypothetical protein F0562_022986 [Nyssa sinensis]|uniref:Uncharacterized protein n=1 Tax=Nyssa sinensis TaxID=561372 RepID=A0A5J5BGN4_9ASTE|nr:hypothetical protein F0562_022986 [Nyssa sinensis]